MFQREDMIDSRIKNIRNLPSNELKTYDKAYRDGQVYKFAYVEAKKELKRRESTTGKIRNVQRKPSRPQSSKLYSNFKIGGFGF
jgi:hypothetical protein